MKPALYSPFNKTYKYLCLQNSIAHSKNKNSAKGLVDSNVVSEKPEPCSSKARATGSSFMSTRSGVNSSRGSLRQSPLVIHRDCRYESRRKQEIEKENKRMALKLARTKCRITPVEELSKGFEHSQLYKTIAMKYGPDHKNKECIFFAQPSLLSTLAYSNPDTSGYLCKTGSSRKKKV